MSEDQENVDKLIAMEWELLADLKKMFNDPALSMLERIRAANALAYHAVVLNKLLAKKGEDSKFNEETLGDFIGQQYADGGMRRRVRRDFRDWNKRLLSRGNK
jgi:hypothetical protein